MQYRVEEMAFRRNNNVDADQHNFQICPQIRADIKIEKENYFLFLTAKVESTEERKTPFDFTVKLFSHFAILKMADIETMRKQGMDFLYPYLRSTVTNLITNANMPGYFLPILDSKPKQAEEEHSDEIKITPLVDGDML